MATYYRWSRSSTQYKEKVSTTGSSITPSGYTMYYSFNKPSLNSRTGQYDDFPMYVSLTSSQGLGTMYFGWSASGNTTIFYGTNLNYQYSSHTLQGNIQRYDIILGKGTFIDYVYSSDISAYPNGGTLNGYYYDERVVVEPPSTPPSITVPDSVRGGESVTISWGASTDSEGNLEGYIVERSTNGGDTWSQIYQGSARTTTNTVSAGLYSVMYRVKAYDSEGLESAYKTSSQVVVINNVAPSAPSSITVPEMIVASGSVAISWEAAFDSDGNLEGYILERSINGGGFSQIYKGNALETTDTAGEDWNTVQYRVCAYDTYQSKSPYTTSESRTVEHLAVAALSVPSLAMEGQQIPIGWPATPAATTYILERKADAEAEFEQIYEGSDTSYLDTAGAWTSVQYRIKAGNGTAFGPYTTSASVPVVSSEALVISGEDSDLGTLTSDIAYTVSSNTGKSITLERRVNGLLIASLTVESGFAYTIPVVDLPTGVGTIVLEATVETDSGPVTASRTWAYTKTPITIPSAGSVGVLQQEGSPLFPPTVAEAVRVPVVWGGTMDKALELLLPILGAAVTAVGSYVGTGTFGSDNPNTLTLSSEPEVVTISGNGKTLTISNTVKTEGGTVGYIEGTTVTWYNDQSAQEQLNQEGVTYTYTAVGKSPIDQLRADTDFLLAMGGVI